MELFGTYMYLSSPIQQRDCDIQICCEYNDDSFILSAVWHFVVIHYISFSGLILINIRCHLLFIMSGTDMNILVRIFWLTMETILMGIYLTMEIAASECSTKSFPKWYEQV